jgi:hypothetical protein
MGQTLSATNPKLSHNAKTMLNVHAKNNYSDHHTIKFSRNDLVDTISALDLNSVIELHGGASKHIEIHNVPSRDRYTEYMSTKTMKLNGGNRGVVAGFSSASEGDLSLIKNMIMGTQTGGAGCSAPSAPSPAPSPAPSYGSPQITFTQTNNTMSASESGCGCETGNSVLQGGGFDLGSILATQMSSNLTLSSSYNPLNSMSESDYSMVGGNMLSSQSVSESSDMYGGNGINFSATSPYNMSQQQGGSLSATSPYNMSQRGGSLSATSPFNMSQQQGGSVFSATSPFNMSHQQGGSNLSATSALPIEYDSLIGGKNKKGKVSKASSSKNDGKKKQNRNPSSSSTSVSSTEESSNKNMFNDVDASSSSTKSESEDNSDEIIKRALRSDAMSEKTRELHRFTDMKSSDKKNTKQMKHKSKDSSDSSSNKNNSSTSTYSKSGSMSSTSNSSETPIEAIGRVNSMKYGNLVLTSEGTATGSESLVNAKQFYSSEHGDLFSSESNFLRNNINKNRLR